jgi:beta-RFAP synthase
MTRFRIKTPSRLHFGLLGWGPGTLRQFGSVGLMIADPGIELIAEPAADWRAEGPLAERTVRVAQEVAKRLHSEGTAVSPAHVHVVRAAREHAGLGAGTQLSLAIVRLLCALAGRPEPSVNELAALSGRGLRSGVGLHGFAAGGLIVDGGHRQAGQVPPLISRLNFPPEWSIVVAVPEVAPGRHGTDELHAFAQLPPIPEQTSERLCRLVLLGLMPAVVEHDLATFGACLTELQQEVGHSFAPAQGGTFAHPRLEEIARFLAAAGIHGAGQSSWGPAVYGFTDESEGTRADIGRRLRDQFGLRPQDVFWTHARNQGATLESEP